MGEATFGKYRLIAELGHGGMADVFLAVVAGPAGSGFSKLTVIKRLRQNLADEPEFVEMLVDEARISARLNHSNVVQTNEVGSVGNAYFIAMEYLDGQPFHRIQHRATQAAQRAREGQKTPGEASARTSDPPTSASLATDPFPVECQYLVLLDTLAGLHHAHELADYDGTPLQIVHRDVTPHNVFVTYEGQVKVVDFGIAKAVGRASETRQGVVKGKVRYMAPEQAIGKPIDRRADVFSVGIMLWEAATGRRLWKDFDDLNIVQALVAGQIKSSPRELVPTVPPEIDRICQKALSANRDDRYSTAEEFRLDLEQYLVESGNLMAARRKIGLAVSTLFADKRAEIRQVIEKQLQALKVRASEVRAVPIPLDSTSGSHPLTSSSGVAVSLRTPVPPSVDDIADSSTLVYKGITDSGTESSGSGTGTGSTGRAAWKSRTRKGLLASRLPLVAAAAAGVVAIGALAFARIGPPAATTPPSAAAPAQVQVRVTASPATAQVTIDGAPVSSPYIATVPRDTHEHLIRAEAQGLETHTELVRYDSDITIVMTLNKIAGSDPKPPPDSKPGAAPVAVRSPGPPPKAAPPPPQLATPPPPTPSAPPAMPSPPHRGQSKPEIDKTDPWSTH